MAYSAPIKRPFTARSASALDQLCTAIKNNDMDGFHAAIENVRDLDAEDSRALRTCIDHNRFAIAKELFLRGTASTLLLAALKKEYDDAGYYYDDMDDYDYDARRHQKAERAYKRLSDWRTTFEKDVLPVLTFQKLQDLQKQITDLRREMTEMISPARTVIKKTITP